jgi:hypothetical protein
LPDGQTVCAAAEFVDHTDGFDSRYRGELRGESVSAADGMQIAGLYRHRYHPNPNLAGTGLRNRAGLKVQNLGRFAYRVGDDRSHCSHRAGAPSVRALATGGGWQLSRLRPSLCWLGTPSQCPTPC